MSDDMNRAGLLLHVCDLGSQWPKLSGLVQMAMAELEDMSEADAKELAERRAEAKRKADEAAAQAAAEAEAERQRLVDEEQARVDAQAKAAEEAKKPKVVVQQDTLANASVGNTGEVERRI